MSKRSRDIDGQIFGKLTVVRFDHVENKRQYYLCRCECGKEKVVLKSNLTTGRTMSCGCNRRKNPPKKAVKPVVEIKNSFPTIEEVIEYHLNKDDFVLTDENYYSQDADKRYCSASQFLGIMGRPILPGCEAREMAKLRGEYEQETTKAMLIGSILDALWEGADSEELVKRFPDCVSTRGATKGQLKSEFYKSIQMYERTLKDDNFRRYMSGEHQTIFTGEIEGLPFKSKLDSFHPGRAIVDLKTTQTTDVDHRIFIPDSGERLPFYLAWSYDVQLAIYRELVRQTTGDLCTCYICAVDKKEHPKPIIIQFEDSILDEALERVKRDCDHINRLKSGEIEPIRCDSDGCDYCRDTYVTTIMSTSEFEAHDIEKNAI